MSVSEPSVSARLCRSLLLPLILALVGWLSFVSSAPPRPAPLDAPADEFSAERAFEHIKAIAAREHPMGSPAHAAARDYLLTELEALGLEVERQRAEVIHDHPRGSRSTRMATVENIVARLPGRERGPALALMTHYDSVPSAPGASDAASCVGIVLETVRAVQHHRPLRNDLVLVITDGEEAGLLGAQAFVREHRWADDIGLVLNFEARGTRGSMHMFETSDHNAKLIRSFASAAPYPSASSMSYEIYRRMPNDTDLTITKAAGIPGLNFGAIDAYYDYHTMGDSVANLDLATVQQGGSNALALTLRFGNQPLPLKASGDATCFAVIGHWLAWYPDWLVLPIAVLAILACGAAVVLARRRAAVSFASIGRGALALVLLSVIVWSLVGGLFDLMSGGGTYESSQYWSLFYQYERQALGFALVTLAIAGVFFWLAARGLRVLESSVLVSLPTALLIIAGSITWADAAVLVVSLALLVWLYRRACPVWGLALGAAGVWVVAAGGLAFLVPGGSFAFAWPALAVLATLLVVFTRADTAPDRPQNLAWTAAGAVLGVLWIPLTAHLVYVSIGVRMPAIPMMLLVLLAGLVAPTLIEAARASRGLVPAAVGAAGLVILIWVAVTSPFDSRHRRPTELFYYHDADADRSYWASSQEKPGEWVRGVLGSDAEATDFGTILPGAESPLWRAPAPAASLPPPEVEVLADESVEDLRMLRFRLSSPRRAEYHNLFFSRRAGIVAARINGREVTIPDGGPEGWWRWRYYALPPQGVEIELEIESPAPVPLVVTEVAYRWPDSLADGSPLPVRPPDTMRMPYSYSDSSVVRRSFELQAEESIHLPGAIPGP